MRTALGFAASQIEPVIKPVAWLGRSRPHDAPTNNYVNRTSPGDQYRSSIQRLTFAFAALISSRFS